MAAAATPIFSPMSTTIEIYSDFICPWCYIGLDRLTRLEKECTVRLHWNPYLLRPDIPAGGVPLSAILPPHILARAEATIREITRAADLPLNRPTLVPNTHQAHEIGLLANAQGFGDAYHRAALRANFAQARNVGDPQVLAAIGEEIGMNRDEILEALHTGRYRAEIDRAIAHAHQLGIRGVPSFFFPSGKGFSGAQPYEVFLDAVQSES